MAADLFTDMLAVRKALAAAVITVTGPPPLRGIHYMPGLVNPPLFVVGTVVYDVDSEGPDTIDELTFTCRLYASQAGAEKTGYELLDRYMSPGSMSVIAALKADPTLGGVCLAVRPQRWTGPGILDVGQDQFIGGLLEVEVH